MEIIDWGNKIGITGWQPSNLNKNFYHNLIKLDNDITLSVEVGGNPNNPALLFIIGLGSQLTFWSNEFINKFVDAGYFVIRFDNRDSGLSSKIDGNQLDNKSLFTMMLKQQFGISNQKTPVTYRLEDMATDTIALVNLLRLAQVHIIGASMGGIVAQIIAATPQKQTRFAIKSLTLIFSTTNCALLSPPKPKQMITFFKKPNSNKQMDVVNHSMWFINTVGSPGFINQQQIKQRAITRFNRSFYRKSTAQQLCATLSTGSVTKYSKKISTPTLILHGSKDGLIPPSHGKSIAKHIKHAKFVLVDGMGHDIASYYVPHLTTLMIEHIEIST